MKKFLLFGSACAVLLIAGLWFAQRDVEVSEQQASSVKPPPAIVVAEPAVAEPAPGVSDGVSPTRTVQGDFGPSQFKQTAVGLTLTTTGFTTTRLDGGVVIDVEGSTGLHKGGAPELPAVVYSKEGRPGYSPVVEVTGTEYEDFPNMDVLPAEISKLMSHDGENFETEISRSRDSEIYETDAFYPPNLVEVEEAYQGKRKLYRVQYHPVQYNPVTRTVRHHKSISTSFGFVPEATIQTTALSGGAGGPEEACDCAGRLERPDDVWPVTTGQASEFTEKRSGAEADACIKILVDGQGLYKITRGNLIAAGVDAADLTGSQLRLFHHDHEIAVKVSQDGLWTNNADFLLFYAEPYRGKYQRQNVYWLGFGGGGLRMNTRAAPNNGGAPEVLTACRKVVVEDEVRYSPATNESHPLFDGWYLGLYVNSSTIVPFTLSGTDHTPAGSVNMTMVLRGLTSDPNFAPDHRVVVKNNHAGQIATTYEFDGDIYLEHSFAFSTALFRPSSTTSGFNVTGTSGALGDAAFLDQVTASWNRYLYVIANQLAFQGQAGLKRYVVHDLNSISGNVVLDVSDSCQPVELTGYSTSNDGGLKFNVQFSESRTTAPCYFVSGAAAVKTVPSSNIKTVTHRKLADPTRKVDYIAVVSESFPTNGYEVLKRRAGAGQEVLVAPVQDIYNEFGYGIKDARAIKQFLGYAFHHYADSPRFVVFVGDLNADPMHNTSTGVDFVPSVFEATSHSYTAQDALMCAVNGNDRLADMAFGRIPVNTENELAAVVSKMAQFEDAVVNTNPFWETRAHLVGGDAELGTFIAEQEIIRTQYLPAGFTTTTGYVSGGGGNAAAIRTGIINAFNSGKFIISYGGHGGVDLWEYDIFTNTDVNRLSNAVFPIVPVWSCQVGNCHQPPATGMAEALLRRPNGGAVAVIAPSGFAVSLASETISQNFYRAMFSDQYVTGFSGGNFQFEVRDENTLGTALLNGLTALWFKAGNSTTETSFYNLFGDPGLRVKP